MLNIIFSDTSTEAEKDMAKYTLIDSIAPELLIEEYEIPFDDDSEIDDDDDEWDGFFGDSEVGYTNGPI